ncbi:hypothetical protein [Aquimarina brevivitae]|uniref:Uncharacterized protein n=1 Tax=Aquimarina brevivitae TaxID=323412 RepID=A0A4Q7PGP3_9FLAO|nr:hypothetical protein [Aquimarina brevivitae]RZS99703.1 hypothetical protein EV197_0926 [Aquimarina brevivitae]
MALIKLNKQKHPWIKDHICSWGDSDNFYFHDFLRRETYMPNVKNKVDKIPAEIKKSRLPYNAGYKNTSRKIKVV